MPSSRRYSEGEIGALIQRATELHEASGSHEFDLSMEEVERIAADLGIPARFVRAAAVEKATGQHTVRKNSLFGSPFRLRVAELLESEIDDEAWADMVLELRRSVSVSGKTEEIGSMKEWNSVFEDLGKPLSGTQVRVRTKDGQSTLEVERFYGGVASFAYLMAGIFGWTMTGLVLSEFGLDKWLIVTLAGSGAVGGLAAVRAGIGLWGETQRKKVQTLSARLRRLASRDSTPANDHAKETHRANETEPAIQNLDDGLEFSSEEDCVEVPQSGGRTRDHS